LSIKFLYRFVEPVLTVWTEGAITYLSSVEGGAKAFEDFALETWRKLTGDLGEVPYDAQWLMNINKVRVEPCHIVPVNAGDKVCEALYFGLKSALGPGVHRQVLDKVVDDYRREQGWAK
jgi:hypothetical protein